MFLDIKTQQITATVPVGKRPWNMALSRDGKKLYVANGRSNSVSVIDTERAQTEVEISVGTLPWGLTIQ
jgi:YVTN family beta-propeller protein